jgi:flagellar assembly protein FliH
VATVEVFQYPMVSEPPLALWDGLGSAWTGKQLPPEDSPSHVSVTAEAPDQISQANRERQELEMAQQRFAEGRQQGIQEGRQMEREAHSAALDALEKRRFEQSAALAVQCAREQQNFLENTEHEVVKLALAVAARILRREAQMDPLFLSGAVRVALGQLSKSSKVWLRVPRADLALWSEEIKYAPSLAVRPEVLAGEDMQTGECTVETEVGTIDLGLRAQLSEIERGFFDRANASPPIASDSRSARQFQEHL